MFTNLDSAKKFARRLRSQLQDSGCDTPLSVCQEITARICQYKDWHHLMRAISHHPNHPERQIVVALFAIELAALGATLDATAILDHLAPANVDQVILHPNGDAFLDLAGQHHMLDSLLRSGQPGLAEFRRGSLRRIVKMVPFMRHLPMFVSVRLAQDDVDGDIDHPLYRQTTNRLAESWFSPAYRALCGKLGFDPDWERPKYRDDRLADLLICAAQHAVWPVQIARTHVWVQEMLIVALDAIRVGEKRTDSHKVREARRYGRYLFHDGPQPNRWREEPPAEELREQLKECQLLDAIRMAADLVLGLDTSFPLADGFCTFDFLPSEHGTGCQPSLYGWAGDTSWTESYGDLAGIAIRPEIDPDDLIRQAAQIHLEKQGVRFLNPEEAQAYLDGDGAYWANRYGYGQVPDGFSYREEPFVVSWIRRVPRQVSKRISRIFKKAS